MKLKDQWFPITVPALIENDVFERAGLRLKKNFEMLGRNKKNKYLLAGRIWCVCGQRRAGEGPQRGKHLYYRCNDRVYSFPLPRSCKEGGINARISDEAVWQRIKMIMSSPELLSQQIKRWLENRKSISKSDSTVDIESTQNEIIKLQGQEDRYANAYSKNIISLEKFEEYVAPLRVKIREFENQIFQANLEKTPKNEILLPCKDEIETFAKEAARHLENLSFEVKKAIIGQTINKIIASRESLQVYGFISLNEIYVIFFSKYRNCGSAECGEVNAV